METNGASSSQTPSKRPKLAQFDFEINPSIGSEVEKLKEAWKSGAELPAGSSSDARLSHTPFTHCELQNFISPPMALDKFIEIAFNPELVQFIEKFSDLLQFKQSLDLNTVDFWGLEEMRTFFKNQVQPFVQKLTALPLTGHVDLFLSEYGQTDHLLCHDDELESRRIAFILYLSQGWEAAFGGALELFGAVDFPLAPTTVATSILPAFNKFVFFDVSCRSFHQVAEVLQPGARRLALSGWFLGEPLRRPEAGVCTLIYNAVGMETRAAAASSINPTYLDSETQTTINGQLEVESEAMLVDFLTPEAHEEVVKELKEVKWSAKGVANVERSQDAEEGACPRLEELFQSKEFHSLLEALTEFEFGAEGTRVRSRVSKFGHKCYQLIRRDTPTAAEGEEEEEDEPQLIDIIYFCGDFENWDESWGGETVYVDGEGEQLISVTPHPNSLAIIVRGASISPYVKYVNCKVGEEAFCCYRATYAFDND